MARFETFFNNNEIEQVIDFQNHSGGHVEIIYPIPWGKLSLFLDVEKAEFRVITKKLFCKAKITVHPFISFGRIDVNCDQVMKYRYRFSAKRILTYQINLIDKNEVNFWQVAVEDKKEFDKLVEMINLVVDTVSPNGEKKRSLKTCLSCGRKINQHSEKCVFCGANTPDNT